MSTYNWNYGGTLDEIKTDFNSGVYLLIFRGSPKRVIYVGTTNCFKRRMEQHKVGYIVGNRTIWRISNNDDIYELMSYQGAVGKGGKYKYYASLARNGHLWAHTSLEKDVIKNDLNKKDDFAINWKNYTSDFFIKNIEIWTCSMSDSADRVLALESKIQRTLQKNYKIGSHIHAKGMSFLGKIEFIGDISNYNFTFNNLPDLDEISLNLLRELPDKKIIYFTKKSYNAKQKLKQELEQRKIQEARLKHKFAYTTWEKQEDEILYTCCKLRVDKEIIAYEYLQRTLKEVNNRINYLSRYYDINNYT